MALIIPSVVATAFPLVAYNPSLRDSLRSYPPHSYHPVSFALQAPTHLILSSFNLCISSIVISITSVLNFSLAASLAVLLGLPLNHARPSSLLAYATLFAVSPMGIWAFAAYRWGVGAVASVLSRTIWEWEVLGAWFLPFVCVVYLPLVLQGMLVCTLPTE